MGEGAFKVEYEMTDTVAQLRLQDARLHFGGVVHFDNAEKICNDGYVYKMHASILEALCILIMQKKFAMMA